MPCRLARTPLAWALALALGACSSVPERPAPDVPDSWFHAVRQQPADAETLADWWQQFDDPVLTQLVRKALNNNRDIRLAMLRVDTARAQLRQARAGLFPTFALPGSASRQWIENNNEPNPNSPIGQFIPDEDVITFDTWELALQASWELDIFGATRARTDSARQQIRSAQAQAIAARLAVASNTAQGYMQVRAFEGQRALLLEGIELAAELEHIASRMFEAGEVTRLDVEASAAERASLQADLDELEINLAEARLALDTLLAEPPGSVAREFEASAKVPLAGRPIPPGQPLDLLRRRPDLIAEAAQLQAAQLQSLAARRDCKRPNCNRWPPAAICSRPWRYRRQSGVPAWHWAMPSPPLRTSRVSVRPLACPSSIIADGARQSTWLMWKVKAPTSASSRRWPKRWKRSSDHWCASTDRNAAWTRCGPHFVIVNMPMSWRRPAIDWVRRISTKYWTPSAALCVLGNKRCRAVLHLRRHKSHCLWHSAAAGK